MPKLVPFLAGAIVATATLSGVARGPTARADYPKPSLAPTSWQLDFQHGTPTRIVVDVPGSPAPMAYWYMTYTVTNNTDQEQPFLPKFEMLTEDGKVVRSDDHIPAAVFERIKAQEKKSLLEPAYKIGGTLRIGEDQQRDGVAIWPDPPGRMGNFSIFVEGLSGEIATVKAGDKEFILRKQLKLNWHIRGDEVRKGEDEVNTDSPPEEWVMR